VTGRRGRRRRQLLDDLKENRGYCKLEEEVFDSTLWRTLFRKEQGPVVRQTIERHGIILHTLIAESIGGKYRKISVQTACHSGQTFTT